MTCWHVHQNGEDFVIKDSWTHESQVNHEADILSKICGLKGVLQLITAWTVQIEGSDDWTDAQHSYRKVVVAQESLVPGRKVTGSVGNLSSLASYYILVCTCR